MIHQIVSLKAGVAALKKHCTSCGRSGHEVATHWKDITCDNCSRKSHNSDRCQIIAQVGKSRESDIDGRQK